MQITEYELIMLLRIAEDTLKFLGEAGFTYTRESRQRVVASVLARQSGMISTQEPTPDPPPPPPLPLRTPGTPKQGQGGE